MNPKFLLSLALSLFIFASNAQPQPTGNLTIFSEDGDKFFLILNGERQNNVAQTNLRVEDLNQQYYTAKVIFEDKTLGEISKNYLAIADGNGALQDVTYKIKKDKNNGKMSLRYFSMAPVQQNYVAPSNVTVVRFGNPTPVASTTVTQTTTTHTTGETVGANVNVGGVNMNVTINDPLLNTNVTTTHTTTTTRTTENTAVVEPPRGCNGTYPMTSGDFSSAVSTIKGQSFDDTRLSTAKQIAGGNCLSATQIADICKIFGFEQSKLDFAKFAYEHCTERSNYFKVNNVFGFSSSVDELNEYISSRQ